MANNFLKFSVFTSEEKDIKPTQVQLALTLEPSRADHDYAMYKNILQEYAQKSGLPLPVYSNENEGFPHAPKFRSSVTVDGTKFTSKLTSANRRAAEQDVAKLAYEIMVEDKKFLTKGPHIYQNPRFCKLILYEYAIKTFLGVPKYNTTSEKGSGRPVFVSSIVLAGKSYTGQVGRSKKEAEQLVAQMTIQSLLGSDSGKLIEIIKRKERIFAPGSAKNNCGDQETKALPFYSSTNGGNLTQQNASIQTGIISYNPNGCTVINARSWTKRKVENNNRELKKKKDCLGMGVRPPGYNFRP